MKDTACGLNVFSFVNVVSSFMFFLCCLRKLFCLMELFRPLDADDDDDDDVSDLTSPFLSNR